jgi:CheY-like chemotaxis protein
MRSEGKTILLVEDDPNDVFFLQYAFESAGVANPVQVVIDGQEAIDYLAGSEPYADRRRFPLPCMVLLDLKLPVKMGTDVVSWIRRQPHLAHLLVVVLTSSSDAHDVDRAYECGAQSYLVKPLSLEKRLEMARAIKNYWLELNEFPSVAKSDDRLRTPARQRDERPKPHRNPKPEIPNPN